MVRNVWSRPAARLPVSRHPMETVVEHRPLQQVGAVGVGVDEVQQPGQRAGDELYITLAVANYP